jgi:hypothetical protein
VSICLHNRLRYFNKKRIRWLLAQRLRQLEAARRQRRKRLSQTFAPGVDPGQSNHRITLVGLQVLATVSGTGNGQGVGLGFGDVNAPAFYFNERHGFVAICPDFKGVANANFLTIFDGEKTHFLLGIGFIDSQRHGGSPFFRGICKVRARASLIVLRN